MRIIFYGLWLTTIVVGSILGTIVPPSAAYQAGFLFGNLAVAFAYITLFA